MKVSIIIPCYNEESRGVGTSCSLFSRLEQVKKDLVGLKNETEVIFIDDGGSDDTYKVISDYIEANNMTSWCIIRHDTNLGKGSAIRSGIRKANGDYIAYIDADLSTPVSYLKNLEGILYLDTCFIASRFLKTSKIVNERPPARQYLSKISRALLSSLFGLRVSDTQCGFKIFPADILKNAEGILRDSRWLIDIELLYVMRVNRVKIIEFPVVWNNMESESTLSLLPSIINSSIDLLGLYLYKGRIRRYFRS